jgi:hypothetical protein
MYVHPWILVGCGAFNCKKMVTQQASGILAGMGSQRQEIASRAAALIVDDGMGYGAAKRQAAEQLGLQRTGDLPDQAELLAAVREHIAVFCPDEQAQTLLVLRDIALRWMARLADFRPCISGAVWNGTATEHSDIHLSLFCDDPKELQFLLIDNKVRLEEGSSTNAKGQEVPVLVVMEDCSALKLRVAVHLTVMDFDDLRNLPKGDPDGEALRGTTQALQARRDQDAAAAHLATVDR